MDYDVEEPYLPYGEELAENEVKRLIDLGKTESTTKNTDSPTAEKLLKYP